MTIDDDAPATPQVLTFGVFELDLDASELRRSGRRVRLAPQPYRALVHLVRNAGRLVTREEMREVIWGTEDVVDFERGMNVCIAQVRDALRDSAKAPRYLETMPRRGYRFVAPVTAAGGPGASGSGAAGSGVADSGATHGPLAVHLGADPAARRRRIARAAVTLLALVVVVVVARIWTTGDTRGDRPAPIALPERMLAVLPFTALTDGPDDAIVTAGLTDELITRLGGLAPAALGVIARTSVYAFADHERDVRAIADTLRVDYILEGTLRRDDDLTRVSAALVDGKTGGRLWSASFDANGDRVLALQADIALRIARSLVPELVDPGLADRLAGRIPPPEAERQYLRGRRDVTGATVAELRAARDAFEDAVRIAPAYALAYAGLAEAWEGLAQRGDSGGDGEPHEQMRDAYEHARAAAQRAVALDSSIASAHLSLGAVALWHSWDVDAAGAHITRALALNPSDPAAHHDRGWWLLITGHRDEGVAELETAVRLDPLSPRAVLDVGWALLRTRDYEGAVEAGRRTLALVPDHRGARFCMHRALFLAGRYDEAYAALRETLPAAGDSLRARLDALPPREAYLTKLAADLERVVSGGTVAVRSAYEVAASYALLGARAPAVRWLETSYARREGSMVAAHLDPSFDAFADDPLFLQIIARVRAVNAAP